MSNLSPEQFGNGKIEVVTGVPPFKPFHKARKMQKTTSRVFHASSDPDHDEDFVSRARGFAKQQTQSPDSRYVLVKMHTGEEHMWSPGQGWRTK